MLDSMDIISFVPSSIEEIVCPAVGIRHRPPTFRRRAAVPLPHSVASLAVA